MTGYWETNTNFSVCGATIPSKIAFFLEKQKVDNKLEGNADIDIGGVYFNGKIHISASSTGSLQGTLTINFDPSHYSTFYVFLNYIEGKDIIEGKLSETLATPCKDGSSSNGQFITVLKPLRNDKYEPNNSATEAFELTDDFEDRPVLLYSNNKSDEDWFKLKVKEDSILSFDLRQENPNDVFINYSIFNENFVTLFDNSNAEESLTKFFSSGYY